MEYDDFVRIALDLPDTEEGMSYGTPGVKRKKRFMFRLKEDGESVAVKLDWENHDRLMLENPGIIFKTPHYEGYPAFLVQLDPLSRELAEKIIGASWADAPHKATKPTL